MIKSVLNLIKLITKYRGKFSNMETAKIIQLKTKKSEKPNGHPLLSMFMVRRHDKFKVITNLAQLTPQELVAALVRDAVWNEKENAAVKQILEY